VCCALLGHRDALGVACRAEGIQANTAVGVVVAHLTGGVGSGGERLAQPGAGGADGGPGSVTPASEPASGRGGVWLRSRCFRRLKARSLREPLSAAAVYQFSGESMRRPRPSGCFVLVGDWGFKSTGRAIIARPVSLRSAWTRSGGPGPPPPPLARYNLIHQNPL
jgi:hypothetical protein